MLRRQAFLGAVFHVAFDHFLYGRAEERVGPIVVDPHIRLEEEVTHLLGLAHQLASAAERLLSA